MKIVVQRVTKSSVSVDGNIISKIGNGLCVLVGIKRDDTMADVKYIAQKILHTRVFDNENGKKWNANVMDKQYEVLCVSQFTLYCTLKGNKLDFHNAMSAQESELLYMKLLDELRAKYIPDLIKDGKFGAMMEVNIENSGPVTFQLESPARTLNSKPQDSTSET